jgi:hypothetical protein
MQRRKFIAGMGSLAAAGAAGIGTGAFTNVSATREINIETEGDASAYLRMDATSGQNSKYTDTDGGGMVRVTLDDVNKDAKSNFLELFEIENQGTQDVILYVHPGSGVSPEQVTVPLPNEDEGRDWVNPGGGEGNVYIDPQASGMPNEDRPFSLTGTYGSSIPEDIAEYEDLGGIGDAPKESLAGTSLYDRTLGVGETGYFGLNVQHEAPASFPNNMSVTLKAVAADDIE